MRLSAVFHSIANTAVNIFVNKLSSISLNISILNFPEVQYWNKGYFENIWYILIICVPERNVLIDATMKRYMSISQDNIKN